MIPVFASTYVIIGDGKSNGYMGQHPKTLLLSSLKEQGSRKDQFIVNLRTTTGSEA
jgi:hypothetical protein